jgi:uncharacterized protein YecE (DUF72 family)
VPSRPLPPPLDPYDAACPVRFGTSSFSSTDWVGPFYPPGTAAGAMLRHYATVFDTVEVDATWYALPSARTVAGWAEKTPPGFLLAAKFPRAIVHGGDTARPDARFVLDQDSTYEVRDTFLERMRVLGPRLGPLVLQFPFFNREAFPSAGPFLERLDRFLGDLPKDGLTYGVEVRNRAWMTPDLRAVAARHGALLVLVDQAWMPHADEVEHKFDVVTGSVAYVRLLGDREAIERVTTTWEKEVLDQSERIDRWAALLVRLMDRNVKSLVYVNNHYAGHAPTTVRRLRDAFVKAAAAERTARPPPEPPAGAGGEAGVARETKRARGRWSDHGPA